MPNKYDVVFQQRDPTNTRFLERVVSGSGYIIQTNAAGVLVGSNVLQVGTISGSKISSSGIFFSSNAKLTIPTASIGLMIGTASYALKTLNGGGGGTTLHTGSTYPITASYALISLNGGGTKLYTGSTYPITASYAKNGGTKLYTGSFYPITSSWARKAISSSNISPPNGVLTLLSASFRNLALKSPNVPSTPTSPGVEGEMKFDNNYAYFYANGKWRRVAFSLW